MRCRAAAQSRSVFPPQAPAKAKEPNQHTRTSTPREAFAVPMASVNPEDIDDFLDAATRVHGNLARAKSDAYCPLRRHRARATDRAAPTTLCRRGQQDGGG